MAFAHSCPFFTSVHKQLDEELAWKRQHRFQSRFLIARAGMNHQLIFNIREVL
jgi:hypothetical protein